MKTFYLGHPKFFLKGKTGASLLAAACIYNSLRFFSFIKNGVRKCRHSSAVMVLKTRKLGDYYIREREREILSFVCGLLMVWSLRQIHQPTTYTDVVLCGFCGPPSRLCVVCTCRKLSYIAPQLVSLIGQLGSGDDVRTSYPTFEPPLVMSYGISLMMHHIKDNFVIF